MNRKRGFLKIAGIAGVLAVIPDSVWSLENIVGNVKDALSGNPVEGAVLKFYNYPSGDFITECLTDSSGNYNSTITGMKYDRWAEVKLLFKDGSARKSARTTSSNIIKAEITHQDYHNAVRYPDLQSNFDTTIKPKSFDMNSFDSWTRTIGKGLQKWTNQPVWKINANLAEQAQVDLVKEIISNDIAEAMNYNPTIEEVNTPDNIETEGNYLVYWREGTGDYFGNHHETLNGNEIVSASCWFYQPNKLRRVFLKTLTQGLGFVRNTSTNDFYTSDGYYNQQGRDMLKVLCSMNAGNISPDSDAMPVL